MMAGWKTQEMLDGLPGVMNLAAASGESLALTSDIVTDALTGFGMQAKDATKFADLLASASSNSNTNVALMGETFKYIAPLFGAVGYSAEDAALATGLMANAGIKGSQAGTALRGAITNLIKPTDNMEAAMNKLGLSMVDYKGEMLPFSDIMVQLRDKFSGLTEEQQAQYAATIFGKEAMSGMLAIINASDEDFEKLTKATRDYNGTAEEMARIMNDNLQGSIELFKSALEGVGITIYESMDNPLRSVVDTLTGYVDKINNTLLAHDNIRKSMEEAGYSARQVEEELKGIPNGFEGAAVVIGEVLADMILKLTEGAPRFLEMGVSLVNALLNGLRQNLPQITTSAIELIQGFVIAFLQILPQVIVLGIELVTNLIQGIAEMLPNLIPVALEAINTIKSSLVVNLPLIAEAGMQIIMMLIEGITKNIGKTINVAMDIIAKIADFLIQNLPLIIDAGVKLLVALINGISNNMPKLMSTVINIVVMVADTIIKNLPSIIKAGLQLIVALVKGIMDNLPKLIKEVPRIINSFADTIYSNLPKILATGVKIIGELIKGLIQSIPTLVKNIPQIIMAIVNVFTLYNWWNLGKGMITKLGEGIKAMAGGIKNIAVNLAKGISDGIVNIFKSAPSWGRNMVSSLGSAISSGISSLVSIGRTLATGAMNAIKGAFRNAPSIGSDLVKGIWNGISNVTGWILSKIKGFGSSIVDGIKDIFKIKSPSQIMRDEVGVMIGKGIAVGIDKSKKDVDNSANRMAKSALDIAKKMNTDIKSETNKYNAEIKQIEKRASEDIYLIKAKAKKAKRKLTADEKIRIQRITENANKKISNIEEKAAKERIKLSQENSKQLIEVSTKFVEDKKAKGQMSLKDEAEFWLQVSLLVKKNSEEYQTALKNHQNAVKQIHDEITKINEDYTKRMHDIDKKLVEDTKKLNEEYAKAYEDRVKDLANVAGLFSEFVEKEEVTGQKLIDNLVSQVVALSEYGAVMETLGGRIGNADLIGELQQLGPKSIGELKALVSMSDEELGSFVALYEKRFELAKEQANKELEPLKNDVENKIKDLNTAAQAELNVLNKEWQASINNVVKGTKKELNTLNAVGKDAIKGLEQGMLSMQSSLMETARSIANSIRTTIQSALDIRSPSRVMRDQVGKNITLGIGEGMEKEMPSLQRNIRKEMSKLTAKMKSTVDFETSSSARIVIGGSSKFGSGSKIVTNNNDNGITQNVTIVSPQNTPSENARQMKKVGRDLALGY